MPWGGGGGGSIIPIFSIYICASRMPLFFDDFSLAGHLTKNGHLLILLSIFPTNYLASQIIIDQKSFDLARLA